MPRRLRVSRLQALTMEAASGSFSMAGFNADLVFARRLTMQCLRGIFQISGFNANLTKQKYTMVATRGVFTMTGRDATFTYTPVSQSLGWLDNIFPMSIAQGSFFDLGPHITGPIPSISTITSNVTLPTGVTITNTPSWRVVAASNATLGTTSGVNLTIVQQQASDWASRIAGTGVVWYHNFDNAAEVNQFRWTNTSGSVDMGGGNDPLSVGTDSNRVFHVASGGVDGGGFMRLTYPAGASSAGSMWWRPFNPITGATNGRGSDDPGANGTITPVAWNVSSKSSTLYNWSSTAVNPGWYLHPTHQASFPGKFQGHDYYFQGRIRRAQTPGPPPDSGQFSNITGKSFWLTTTPFSNPAQEIVNYGESAGNNQVVGTQPRHNAYSGQNFTNMASLPGATVTLSNWNVNWRYSGGWDTLLIHVVPGTDNGTGANRTLFEVWAQHDLTLFPAEAGTYTKIWEVLFPQGYTTSSNSAGAPCLPGWNAVLLAIYHNGATFSTSFQYDYDQVIFSKNFIPAPTV
jgi:hypothetical protein